MINVLDVETYKVFNGSIVIYCVCFIFNNSKYSFYNISNIVINCLNQIVCLMSNKSCEFFIHNINFDGILIISELSRNLIKYELVSNKTNLYSIKIFYCNKLIVLKCSYKIMPISLRKLGDIEGYSKTYFPYTFVEKLTLNYIGPIPHEKYWESGDYDNYLKLFGYDVFDLKKKTIEYCFNDVFLTQKMLINLFKVIDSESRTIRRKSLSAPSMSHKFFYSFYNNHHIEENIRISEESYIRPSYFGGRCEVFGNPHDGEIIKYYDFSGMYGQCMLEKFHCGEFSYSKTNSVNKPGFYNITYKSDMNIPVLPVHQNNKLLFCNGTNTGTFWFEEINFFEEKGGSILKINNALTYENYDNVFHEFITKFNDLRNLGGYYKIFGKLMINSLYGSMALKQRENFQYITFSEEEFSNIYKNTTVEAFYKIESCYILIVVSDYKSKKFFTDSNLSNNKMVKRNVSYASAIASKARIKLYKAFDEVAENGGRLLYCDTDSVFASYEKFKIFTSPKSFTWLDEYADAVFISPKTYGLQSKKEEIRIKGIRVGDLCFNNLKSDFYAGADILFNNQLFLKKSDFNLKQLYVDKKINVSNYNKRIFSANKKTTGPIYV